jgi:hypothetical protein
MPSIRLHPEHGVNPTIAVCNWCGKDKNEIVLLGSAYKQEAPRRMIVDDEPCDACKADMAKGITFIEMDKEGEGGERTGRWCVLREEGVIRIIDPPELLQRVLKMRKAFVTPATSMFLGLFTEPGPEYGQDPS